MRNKAKGKQRETLKNRIPPGGGEKTNCELRTSWKPRSEETQREEEVKPAQSK